MNLGIFWLEKIYLSTIFTHFTWKKKKDCRYINISHQNSFVKSTSLLLLLQLQTYLWMFWLLKSLESLNDRVRALVTPTGLPQHEAVQALDPTKSEVVVLAPPGNNIGWAFLPEAALRRYLALSLKLLTSNVGHFFCGGKRLRSSMTTSFLGAICRRKKNKERSKQMEFWGQKMGTL